MTSEMTVMTSERVAVCRSRVRCATHNLSFTPVSTAMNVFILPEKLLEMKTKLNIN